MNTPLPMRWPLAACLAAAIAVGVPSYAAPQDEIRSDALISLRFRGGTAAGYVNAIRAEAPHSNILVDPAAEQVQMPALELTRVSVRTALELLDGRIYKGQREQIEIDVRKISHHPREEPALHIRALVIGTARQTETHVWSIAAILEYDMTDEAVISAVNMALEVVNSPTKPDIRFHEDTALIIVRGDRDQLSAIEDVVNRLEDAVVVPDAGGADAGKLLEARNAMHLEIDRLAFRVETLQRALDQNEAELIEARTEVRGLQAALDAAHRRGGN